MATPEESPDPRETLDHPRRQHNLRGHREAEARLLHAIQAGRLHHAWLLSGPRGIGKATLAYRVARFLFAFPDPAMAQGLTTLEVAAGSPAARHVAAGAHPGLLVLERAYDIKNKRIKSEVAVDDARRVTQFFSQTSGHGGWRIAVVDTADDLNRESANALLKIIEEPPSQSLFLLVSHQPGSLLRTIRSRCIQLPLSPLGLGDTMAVLREMRLEPTGGEEELRRAAELSGGCPGRAAELVNSRGAQAFATFRTHPAVTPAIIFDIARTFGARDAAADFAIFCELLVDWTARKAREAGLRGGGAALAQAHDDIAHSLRRTDALNLDRRQAVVEALTRLGDALRAA